MRIWPFYKKEKNQDLDDLNRMLFELLNKNMPINKMVNLEDFITLAYMFNPTVYSIISLIARAAKGIPWIAYKVTNQPKFRRYQGITRKDMNLGSVLRLKEEALEEITGTQLNKVLERPNGHQTMPDLVEELFTYKNSVGNAYIYDVAMPSELLELHSLPAHKVKIVGGNFLNPVTGYTFDALSKLILPVEKIQHWKTFNPNWKGDGSSLYGMSPLMPGARIINSDNMGIDSQTASFLNQGVKGVLTGTQETQIPFTKEQGEELQRRWRKLNQQARDGKGDMVFNRAPLAFVKVGETPVDLGVMDARKYNKEVLCNMFGIHPSLLSSEASTLDNFKEARKQLITNAVMPDMDNLRDKINRVITRIYGPQYYVDYDLMAISELQDDLEKLGRTLQGMDWITINEKRRATDYDDYEHPAAEQLYTDMGKIPIGQDVNTDMEWIDQQIDKARNELATDRQ